MKCWAKHAGEELEASKVIKYRETRTVVSRKTSRHWRRWPKAED